MKYPTEKLCLKWNDFQQNIASSYQELQKGSDFSDVTLVCEENQQFEAHIIILAACSPFFKRVLKENKHSHPMIYMRGLKPNDLEAILDFIYKGEANVYQEDLSTFLALAEELQLKGLAGYSGQNLAPKENVVGPNNLKTNKKLGNKLENSLKSDDSDIFESHTLGDFDNQARVPIDYENLVVSGETSFEDLKLKLDSMLERCDDGENKWKCVVCGKMSSYKAHMRSHVEKHIKGLSYPCNQWGRCISSFDITVL